MKRIGIPCRGYVICYACLTWWLGQMLFPLVGEDPPSQDNISA